MELTRDAVLWFAGLFEGEGWFRYCPPKRRSMGIGIKMTDRDVLEKAQRYFGGWIWDGAKKAKPHHKQSYHWKHDRRDQAYALLVAIYPFLGERRKQQAEKWIAQYTALKPLEATPITHGLPSSYNGRGCRCEVCTEGWRVWSQGYRIRRQQRDQSLMNPATN